MLPTVGWLVVVAKQMSADEGNKGGNSAISHEAQTKASSDALVISTPCQGWKIQYKYKYDTIHLAMP